MKRLASLLVFVMLFGMFTTSVFGAHHEEAKVRIVHASPDAPAVDIVVNGETVVENAGFQAATGYLMLPAGEHEVQLFVAGTVADGSPVLTQTLAVEAGKAYTVAAVNTVANLELLVMNDETMTTAGKTKIRVAHLSPDAPAVDVAVTGGDVVFANAPFKSVTNYLELDPATLDLEVRVAGTEDVVLSLPGTELKADTLYTVLAVGFAGGEPALTVLPLADPAHQAVPTEMPATGFGGASQDYTMLWVFAAIMIGAAGTLVFFRKTKAVSR
ncbi:DUF4397 domain-containing protein [Bacillus sp. HMF5848]|uniref:DUF4397 domain-containing protein n=1 Tax=Bacillus sp. HMF5848 TaxID=2495421 RepID=UPI000F76CFAA|nr:DUF4397 domain-containing protein [Bacillus sp. HMF5848]RSK25938.1 DUF4397 domain-containing protein [Bacillus sp. HMF5848]